VAVLVIVLVIVTLADVVALDEAVEVTVVDGLDTCRATR
jgi:hypothetical protein